MLIFCWFLVHVFKYTGIDHTIPTIQVDFDRMMLGKFRSYGSLWGEIGVTADILLEKITDIDTIDPTDKIKSHWDFGEKENFSLQENKQQGTKLCIIFNTLSDILPENAIISVDVGNNTYSFGRYFECKNQSVLMSGYLGSIGFGFHAAMGAAMSTTSNCVN